MATSSVVHVRPEKGCNAAWVAKAGSKTWARMTKVSHNRLHCQRHWEVEKVFGKSNWQMTTSDQTKPPWYSYFERSQRQSRLQESCKQLIQGNIWTERAWKLDCLMEKCNHCNYLTLQVGPLRRHVKIQCIHPAVHPSYISFQSQIRLAGFKCEKYRFRFEFTKVHSFNPRPKQDEYLEM